MLNVARPPLGWATTTPVYPLERITIFKSALVTGKLAEFVPRNDTVTPAFIWMASCENAIASIKAKKDVFV